MSWRELVEISVASLVMLGGIIDLVAYLQGGYSATVTATVRDLVNRHPGILLFVGMLVDHLFLK
jgi:hypothetical protein